MAIPIYRLQKKLDKKQLINIPNQLAGEEPKKDIILKDNIFMLNNKLEVQQTQNISIEVEERIDLPFETFRGRFILNWSELKKEEVQIITPHNIKFTLRFPKYDGEFDEREYNLRVYKFLRNNFPKGHYYPELGEYQKSTSHSEFEWWGVPDYQYILMGTNMKQYSFRKKKYHEIFKTIQEDVLKVDYKQDEDEFIEKCLNEVPKNDSLLFPSTVPTLSVIEQLVMNTWYPQDISNHAIPIYFINNKKFYYKIQYKENQKTKDIYIGDLFEKMVQEKGIEDISKDQEEKKYIFDSFEIINPQRSSLFGTMQRRNSKHIHEQKDEQKIPLKHKKTYWMNNQNSEPLFKEYHENYKEYWEYDQYYLDDEYFLENRMQKKYNLQLQYSFYGQEKIRFIQSNMRESNMLEDLKLQNIVKIHLKDSQLTNRQEKEYEEKVYQMIFSRNLLINPQIQQFNINIVANVTGKWTNYKEDEETGFWQYIGKHDKDKKSYEQD